MRYYKTIPAIYKVGPKLPCAQHYENALSAVIRQCLSDYDAYQSYYNRLTHAQNLKLKRDHELELLWTQPRL